MKKHIKSVAALALSAGMFFTAVPVLPVTPVYAEETETTANDEHYIWEGATDTSWYDEEDTELHISTPEEFTGFLTLVSTGVKMEGQQIILDKDIFLNDISEFDEGSEKEPTNAWKIKGGEFSGTFDGNKHIIYGYYGGSIIGTLSEDAYFKNISFEKAKSAPLINTCNGKISDCNVDAVSTASAMLCYKNNGSIISCTSNGKINSSGSAAGICYESTGIIEDCINNATINVDNTKGFGSAAGIVCSALKGSVSDCINNGIINCKNINNGVGGIGGTVSECYNCYNYANIIASDSRYVGGICGRRIGKLTNCINNGNIEVNNTITYDRLCIGGIAGCSIDSEQVIEKCGNNGNINCESSIRTFIGGIFGAHFDGSGLGIIKYSYNTGNIEGSSDNTGGIAGNCNKILSSYNTGNVTGRNAGGLVCGVLKIESSYSAASKIESSGTIYTLGETTEVTSSYYLNSAAASANVKVQGTAKSAANMKKEEFVKSLGDAFVYNKEGYPMLFWEINAPVLSVNKEELSLSEYKQQEKLIPSTTYEGKLNWSSSDEKVATVDENGVVTAVGNGTCTISVEAIGSKATCAVTVAYDYYLNEVGTLMKPDLAKEMVVYSRSTEEPANVENIKFYSSNEEVAEVNERGIISANIPGNAEIHAVIGDVDLVCKVKVEEVVSDYDTNKNYGDINNDNTINLKDVVILRRYIAGGWGINIDETIADVNDDGAVNLKDVVLLRRYIAGGWNVTLKSSDKK